MRVLATALAVGAAVAAIAVANVVLLGQGSERSDRVGKLSPVAPRTRTAPVRTTTTAPATTNADDDHGRGRGRDDDRDLDD